MSGRPSREDEAVQLTESTDVRLLGTTSFESFFRTTYQRVVASITVSIGDQRAAEDAAQEAYTKALVRWSRVSEMDRPDAWVLTVAVRAARRSLTRAERGYPSERIEWLSPAASEPDGLSAGSEILSLLSPRERLAVVLRFVEDLQVSDVAEVMGCAPGTVKATLHSAMTKLRTALPNGEIECETNGEAI